MSGQPEPPQDWADRMLAAAVLDICAAAYHRYGHCLYTWEVVPDHGGDKPDYEALAEEALTATGWDENQGPEGVLLYRRAAESLRQRVP